MKRRTVTWMNEYTGRLILGKWSQVHIERDHSRTACGQVYPGRLYLQQHDDERRVTCARCLQSLALGQGKGRRRKVEPDRPDEQHELDGQLALFFAGGGLARQLPDAPDGQCIGARPIHAHTTPADEDGFLAVGDMEDMTAPLWGEL